MSMQGTPMNLVCAFIKNLDLVQFQQRLKLLDTDITHLKKLLYYFACQYAKLNHSSIGNNSQRQNTVKSQYRTFYQNNSTRHLPTINQLQTQNQQQMNLTPTQNFGPSTFSDIDLLEKSQNISRQQSRLSSQSSAFLRTQQDLDIDSKANTPMQDYCRRQNQSKKLETIEISNFDSSTKQKGQQNQLDFRINNQKQNPQGNDQKTKVSFSNNSKIMYNSVDENERRSQPEDLQIQNKQSIKVTDVNEINQQIQKYQAYEVENDDKALKNEKEKFDIDREKLEQQIAEISLQHQSKILELYENLWNQANKKIEKQQKIIENLWQILEKTKELQPKSISIHKKTSDATDLLSNQWFLIYNKGQILQNDLTNYLVNMNDDPQPQSQQSIEKNSQVFKGYMEEIKQINQQNQILADQVKLKMRTNNEKEDKSYDEAVTILIINIEILERTSILLEKIKDEDLLQQRLFLKNKIHEQIQQFEKHQKIATSFFNQIEKSQLQDVEVSQLLNALALHEINNNKNYVSCLEKSTQTNEQNAFKIQNIGLQIPSSLQKIDFATQTQNINACLMTNSEEKNQVIIEAEMQKQKEKEEFEKLKQEVNEKYEKNKIKIYDDVQQLEEQKQINQRAQYQLKHQTTLEMYRELLEEWQKISDTSESFQKDLKKYLENLNNQTQKQNEKHSQNFNTYNQEITNLNDKINHFIELLKLKMNLDKDNKGKLYKEAIQILTFNIKILQQTQALLNQLMKQMENKNKQYIEQQAIIIKKVEERNQQFNEFSQIIFQLLKQIDFQEKLINIKKIDDQKIPSQNESQDSKNQLFSCLQNSLMSFQQIFTMKQEEYIKMVKEFKVQDGTTQKQLRQMISEMQHQITALKIQFFEGSENHYVIYQLQPTQ